MGILLTESNIFRPTKYTAELWILYFSGRISARQCRKDFKIILGLDFHVRKENWRKYNTLTIVTMVNSII